MPEAGGSGTPRQSLESVSEADRERLLSGTALEFLGVEKGAYVTEEAR